MHALIVDDDEIALDCCRCHACFAAIGPSGSKGRARNGRESQLEMLRTNGSRLLITDWEMPEMTGIELCRAIRQEDLTGYVYIIMLTSRQGEQESMEGIYASYAGRFSQ